MISHRPLHHQIWEREIEKLETFAECISQFIGCEKEFWRLFDKADLWKKIFGCRIWDRFSALCDHQINVFATFLAPLMRHLVVMSFHERFEDWSDASKLAFTIIYKIHTLGFETQLEENLNQLTRQISEDMAMIDIWTPNQAHNEQKLCETIQIYWQLFCTSSEALLELKIRRSIIDCDDCLPLHDMNCVTKLRHDNMALIWTLPDKDEEELLRRMRPFIVNVCSPPAEEDLDTFVNFIGLQNSACSHNMSRWLLQDRDIIRKWARLLLTFRPSGSWDPALQLLQALLGLFLGKRRLKWLEHDHHWSQVEERLIWFGEVYIELVQENPDWALGVLIRGPRLLNIRAIVMISAILLYNGALIERDQLDIVDGAVGQYNEIVQSRSSELAEEYRNYLSLLQLCLHREICVRIMLLKHRRVERTSHAWLSPIYFTEEILDHCAFRFLNSESPRKIFQAAIHTIEVALLYKTKFRRKISARFGSRLAEVVDAGGQNGSIAAIELNEFKRVKNLMTRRRKTKQKRSQMQTNQKDSLLKTKPVTVAT